MITFNDNHIPFDEPVDTKVYQQYHLELIEANYTIETDTNDGETVQEHESETTSDEIIHSQYVIISANPSFHMTENLFTIIANNVNTEYTESENTTENPNEDESDDEPDEVVIDDSSQNDESDEENESDGDEDI